MSCRLAARAVFVWLVLWTGAAAWAGGSLLHGVPAEVPVTLRAITVNAPVSAEVRQPPYMVRPEIFEYLIDHPNLIADLARGLGLSRMHVTRTASGFLLDDGWGLVGECRVLLRRTGFWLLHARGYFDPPVFPRIHGEAIVALAYGYEPRADGKEVVSTSAAGYVRFESRIVNFVARLARPIAQSKAEQAALSVVRDLSKVHQTLQERGELALAGVAGRDGLAQREVEELRRLLARR